MRSATQLAKAEAVFASDHPVTAVMERGKAEQVIPGVVASTDHSVAADGGIWPLADPPHDRGQHHDRDGPHGQGPGADGAIAMSIDPGTFRDLLLQRLAELDEQDRMTSADRDPVALDQESVGRLSRIDAMQVQAMALAQERRRKSERVAIAAALQRIEEGDFGYCIECGDEIAKGRLQNNPTVVKCLECACREQLTAAPLRIVHPRTVSLRA